MKQNCKQLINVVCLCLCININNNFKPNQCENVQLRIEMESTQYTNIHDIKKGGTKWMNKKS